ncbi:MAG: hypothetical protein ACOVP1_02510 [Bacteroidia bacterium]
MNKAPQNLEELRLKKLLLKQEIKFQESELKRQNQYLSQNKLKLIWKEISPFSKNDSSLGIAADLILPGILGALGLNKISGNRILISLAQVLIGKLAESGLGKIFKKKKQDQPATVETSNEESNV